MSNKIKFAVGAALFGLSVSANAGVVDLFDTPDFIQDLTISDGGVSSSVVTGGGDILGAERDIYVEKLTGTSVNSGVQMDISGGSMAFSVDSLQSGTGTVQWDGAIDAGSTTLDVDGLGGVDLTEGGTLNAFALDVLEADLGFTFEIGLYTDANFWSVASLTSSAVSLPGATNYLLFSDFLLCGAVTPTATITCGGAFPAWQPVDFSNLGAIELVIDPLGAAGRLDMALDNVTTVPEPSVLGLIGAGLLAGGFVARRRKNENKTA